MGTMSIHTAVFFGFFVLITLGETVCWSGNGTYGRIIVPRSGTINGITLTYHSGYVTFCGGSHECRSYWGHRGHSNNGIRRLNTWIHRSTPLQSPLINDFMYPRPDSTKGFKNPDRYGFYEISGYNAISTNLKFEGPHYNVTEGEELHVYYGEPIFHPAAGNNNGPEQVCANISFQYVTLSPTSAPSWNPTTAPSASPILPSAGPSLSPTAVPSIFPSTSPSKMPTISPSSLPTSGPTSTKSSSPSSFPTQVSTAISAPNATTSLMSPNPKNSSNRDGDATTLLPNITEALLIFIILGSILVVFFIALCVWGVRKQWNIHQETRRMLQTPGRMTMDEHATADGVCSEWSVKQWLHNLEHDMSKYEAEFRKAGFDLEGSVKKITKHILVEEMMVPHGHALIILDGVKKLNGRGERNESVQSVASALVPGHDLVVNRNVSHSLMYDNEGQGSDHEGCGTITTSVD